MLRLAVFVLGYHQNIINILVMLWKRIILNTLIQNISNQSTHQGLQLLGLSVEGICYLPGGNDGYINEQQHAHNHKQLIVLDHFLVEFKIGKDGVHSPGLREHGSKTKTEPSHQNPSSSCANVGKSCYAA